MLGTSAALAESGIPFAGPIGAAQVGYKDGAYILNPTVLHKWKTLTLTLWLQVQTMRVLNG